MAIPLQTRYQQSSCSPTQPVYMTAPFCPHTVSFPSSSDYSISLYLMVCVLLYSPHCLPLSYRGFKQELNRKLNFFSIKIFSTGKMEEQKLFSVFSEQARFPRQQHPRSEEENADQPQTKPILPSSQQCRAAPQRTQSSILFNITFRLLKMPAHEPYTILFSMFLPLS